MMGSKRKKPRVHELGDDDDEKSMLNGDELKIEAGHPYVRAPTTPSQFLTPTKDPRPKPKVTQKKARKALSFRDKSGAFVSNRPTTPNLPATPNIPTTPNRPTTPKSKTPPKLRPTNPNPGVPVSTAQGLRSPPKLPQFPLPKLDQDDNASQGSEDSNDSALNPTITRMDMPQSEPMEEGEVDNPGSPEAMSDDDSPLAEVDLR